MILFEAHARLLLVTHALVAAFLVGASTHQALWCRGYRQGRFGRAATERRVVPAVALSFLVTFALGSVLYPTYKVRVRAEYFDAPSAIAAEDSLRRAEASRLAEGRAAGLTLLPPGAAPSPPTRAGEGLPDLSWVGRLFDIKEHWAALGAGAAIALWLLAWRAHPSTDARFLAAYLGLSWLVAGTAWTGAVIGLLTAAHRAVGGLR